MAAPMPRVPPVTNATRGMMLLPHLTSSNGTTEDGRQTTDIRRPYLSSVVRCLSLHAHRNAHAAADAQCGETLLGIALAHLVEQRHQHAGARGADRMADGDGAAIDVDLAGVPAEGLVDGAGLRRECLVGFDEVEIADIPAGFLQR